MQSYITKLRRSSNRKAWLNVFWKMFTLYAFFTYILHTKLSWLTIKHRKVTTEKVFSVHHVETGWVKLLWAKLVVGSKFVQRKQHFHIRENAFFSNQRLVVCCANKNVSCMRWNVEKSFQIPLSHKDRKVRVVYPTETSKDFIVMYPDLQKLNNVQALSVFDN